MNVAVIPARGGSKRIPRKNVREFCGKPMIVWSIEAAIASGCFTQVLVSTDDPDIASIAAGAGADVPFLRPAALSDDHAGTTAVVAHAVDWLTAAGVDPEFVCCIYATAPFLHVRDLQEGLARLVASDASFAISATSYAFPIQRAFRIDGNGRMEMFQPENFEVRSQDLEPAYHDAAQFYWGRTRSWQASSPLFGRRTIPILLPRERVQDIDTEEDWLQAERIAGTLWKGA